MKAKQCVSVLLATFLLMMGAVSCAGKQEDPKQTTETPTTVTVAETIAPIPQQEMDYGILLNSVFANVEETSAEELTYTVQDQGIRITGYTGEGTTLCIPDEIEGKSVVGIKDGAFANHVTLETVVIPDSVQQLGTEILKGCTSVYALYTPLMGADANSDQYLGYLFGAGTYQDNPRDVPPTLHFLSLGGTYQTLPSFALYDCNDLLAVRLPDSVTKLETYSMYRCSSLQYLNTERLAVLEDHAMDSCAAMTHLRFGAELQSMGLGALEGCSSLKSLTLPFVGGSAQENTFLGYVFGATIPDFAKGYYPKGLVEVEVLSSCTSLGNYAFYECEPLTYLHLNEGISSIGVRAFDGCIRLREVSLPNSLRHIGENAFFGCWRMHTLTIGTPGASALSSIGINAFYGCESLTSVTLPYALTSLPASCFADCKSLQFIHLGGVTRVGKNAFRNCASLRAVDSVYPVSFEEGNAWAQPGAETD